MILMISLHKIVNKILSLGKTIFHSFKIKLLIVLNKSLILRLFMIYSCPKLNKN